MHTVSMPYGDTGWGYGFGWEIAWNVGRKIVSHSGGLPGIATYALMVPAERLGVVVLTNSRGWGAQQIAEQLVSTVLGTTLLRPTFEDPVPFNTRYTPPCADTLAQYVGKYTRVYRAEEEQINVEMKIGKLILRYTDGEAISFIAISKDVFLSRYSGNWRPIHFVRDPEGNVTSLLQRGHLFQRRG